MNGYNVFNLMNLKTFKRPLIIAHRGCRDKYPENTCASFKAAIDAQIQMIEFDVMLSRDRKIVVIHDATLERTTNGRGPVSNYTLEELKRLDAGSWFDSRFSREHIPTLQEALDQMANRVYINIELKSSAYEANRPPDRIERQVVKLVKKKNICNSVIISSFEWKMLEDISKIDGAPAIALISRDPTDNINRDLCARLKVFSWNPKFNGLDYKQVKEMHEMGIKVFPYKVDSLEQYEEAVRMEVDGVITSNPIMIGEAQQVRM